MRGFKLSAGSIFIALMGSYGFAQTPETGVEGVIMIGPVRPGPIHRDTPLAQALSNTAFVAQTEAGSHTSFSTDSNGHFRVLLAPGHYSISKEGPKSSAGFFGPFEVDVFVGKMIKVEWNCDSGMR
jgi:hypothetical protein